MKQFRVDSRVLKAGFLFSDRFQIRRISPIWLSLILILLFSTWFPVQGQTDAQYPITVIDALDREVTITEQPQAIVSLSPSVTETLFAIGAGPQVVGRTEYCDYPAEVEELPIVGGFSASSISVETIVALEPDLIIAGAALQSELVEPLEQAGITVFVIDATSIGDIFDSIQVLGEITGNIDGAQHVINDMNRRIGAVAISVNTIPQEERATVFYEVWHEPLMTTTLQTFIGELITLGGGVNIFNTVGEAYPTVSAEQIIESDPDVILGPSSHGDQLTAEMIASREGWETVLAVVEERIYIIDGSIISHSGPRIADALEIIAAQLYPELFESE